MNEKAAARGGADSGGGEQSDERGPFSFLCPKDRGRGTS